MDILIKSFNRPYYLDRCLFSIYKYGLNFNGNIYILDDGTPQKYLNKIIGKYPYVEVLKSEFYEEKTRLIANSNTDEINRIPIDLWILGAQKASNYFLLLEDDFWFIKEIDFEYYDTVLLEKKITLLKLIWLGNENLISGKTILTEKKYLIYKPDVYTLNPYLFKIIFNLNRFGFNKMMNFLKIYSEAKYLKYYSMYSVAGAFFNKNYFLSLWDNHNETVDERLQLSNAVTYINKSKDIKFSRTEDEYLKTGFSSSATNKKGIPIKLDMFKFNKLINDAWVTNEFVATNSLENDFNEESICEIIRLSDKNKDWNVMDWKEWVLHFKNQFRKIGCKID